VTASEESAPILTSRDGLSMSEALITREERLSQIQDYLLRMPNLSTTVTKVLEIFFAREGMELERQIFGGIREQEFSFLSLPSDDSPSDDPLARSF
jgi:hypothetical protein